MTQLLENLPLFLKGTAETLYMTFGSALFAYLFGLPLGVLVVITRRDGILPRPRINAVLEWIVNIGRSVPFLILMVAMIPVTRFVAGKAIGPTAAIVSLVTAAVPFVARMVEGSLSELDRGVLEAARTMGATTWDIILHVYLPESLPSLVRGVSLTTITLMGYSAMGGACGAGGLGDIAIRFGYHRYQYDMMVATIVLLILFVQIIQSVFSFLSKKIDRRIV